MPGKRKRTGPRKSGRHVKGSRTRDKGYKGKSNLDKRTAADLEACGVVQGQTLSIVCFPPPPSIPLVSFRGRYLSARCGLEVFIKPLRFRRLSFVLGEK